MPQPGETHTTLVYSVHPGVAYAQAIVANLPRKTGRSMDEWVQLVQTAGPSAEKARCSWLRAEHRLGGTVAG